MTLMESLFNFFVSRVVPLFVSRAIKHEADILYLYVLLYYLYVLVLITMDRANIHHQPGAAENNQSGVN